MKKLIYFAVSILLFSACQNNEKIMFKDFRSQNDSISSDSASIRSKLEKLSSEIQYLRSVDHGRHFISYYNVRMLILDYLNYDFSYATTTGFGGYLPIDTNYVDTKIKDPQYADKFSGLLIYFCNNNNSTTDKSDDKLFIAYRPLEDFDLESTAISNLNDNLDLDTTLVNIKYTELNNDTSKIRKFLEGPYSIPTTTLSPIKLGTIRSTWAPQFQSHFDACINPLRAATRVTCNEVSYFFIEKRELREFLAQSGTKGIRFFCGLDNSENNNKIRIVFFAAQSSGNLLYDGNHYAKFLERSHP